MESQNIAKNLYQRIAAVMQDVQRLQKDKQVGENNYAYKAMSEEKVTSVIRAAMITHGLVILPVGQSHSLTDYSRLQKVVSISAVDVTYKLVNVDNPAEFEMIVSSGTGVDSQDKGVGKAMTYSMKYALLRLFMIPTGNDPDEVHNTELDKQQQAALDAAMVDQKRQVAEAIAKMNTVCISVDDLSMLKATLPDFVIKHPDYVKAGTQRYNQIASQPVKA